MMCVPDPRESVLLARPKSIRIARGPGESKHADIGISLRGTGEAPAAPVFIDGEKRLTLRGERIAEEFHALVENYIEKRFG